MANAKYKKTHIDHRVESASETIRDKSIDWLRGISIIGVLVIHSGFISRFDEKTLEVWVVLLGLFDWSVVSFFFISGVLLREEPFWKGVVIKRVQSLILPFVLYNAVYSVLFFMGDMRSMGVGAFENISLAGIGYGLVVSPGFQLYFLPYLFIATLISSLILRLSKQYSVYCFCFGVFVIVGYYMIYGYPEHSHGPEFYKIPLYIAGFFLGAGSRSLWQKKNDWNVFMVLLAILACFIFIGTMYLMNLGFWPLLVPVVLLLFAKYVFPLRSQRDSTMKLLGRYSGSVYLWHTPLTLPFFSVVLSILGLPSIINMFAAILLTIGTCVVVRIYLDRIYLQFFGRRCPRFITL